MKVTLLLFGAFWLSLWGCNSNSRGRADTQPDAAAEDKSETVASVSPVSSGALI